MISRILLHLVGVVCIYSQGYVSGDFYIAELMVETGLGVNAKDVLSILNTTSLQVNSTTGVTYTVTLLQNELVAECLIIGTDSSCNCSTGYTWSNDVCYNYNCCSETTCTANVSYITPLCVPKVNVQISGSVTLSSGTWDAAKTSQLQTALRGLNGFQYMNMINQSTSGSTGTNFNAVVSVRLQTKKLQDTVTTLQTQLSAVIWVNTLGMVKIVYPNTTVCYESSPMFTCTFEEATDSASWNMIQGNQRIALSNGNVVQLNNSCTNAKYKSCTVLTLQKVTGAWAETYECDFTTGSVTHTATAKLNVTLLPDVITMVASPPTADCSQASSVDVSISTTIPQTSESYEVSCALNAAVLPITSSTNGPVYTCTATITCKDMFAQYVNVTFTNTKLQSKSARLDIQVIYANSKFCKQEGPWPNTPDAATVINSTCPEGRVGFQSRTCSGTAWQNVVDSCVNQQLNAVSNAAANFLNGLGATQENAVNIFQGLQNSSTSPSSNIADVTASISILSIMADASNKIALKEDVLPNFINAASNLLNNTWSNISESALYSMSSSYLMSVEGLVKNIKVNVSQGVNSTNLELKFCSSSDCGVSVFDVGVNMIKTNGTLKTVGVKNLMNNLRNKYSNMTTTSLLLSATLDDNNDSSLVIRLNFPAHRSNDTKPLCVFWNTTDGNWSDIGCFVNTSDQNHTLCECNHLTSFSVLMSIDMSTNPTSNKIQDIITNVGLAVSVCSLLIFLTVECLVWSAVVKTNLSHFRHTAMVNIATFLLLADISFLASTSPDVLSDSWCLILTICKHLFFLAMFCWMLCLSLMLVHQLVFVFNPLRKRVFIIFSGIVGYVCPILIVGSSYLYYKYIDEPYYIKETCWLDYDRLMIGSIHTFLLPVGTIILTNLFFMVVVITTLMKSTIPDKKNADDKGTAKSILKVVVILTPVFGITWIFGFIKLIMLKGQPMYDAVDYCFTVLNSFQGFFVFLTGCFGEQKVREELFRILTVKSKGKGDSTKNLISVTYTREK